jgi:hypothetical protein
MASLLWVVPLVPDCILLEEPLGELGLPILEELLLLGDVLLLEGAELLPLV